MLSVNVGRFGWAAIATPALSGMLPNSIPIARIALTMRASDLESHLIRGVKPKTDLDSTQARRLSGAHPGSAVIETSSPLSDRSG